MQINKLLGFFGADIYFFFRKFFNGGSFFFQPNFFKRKPLNYHFAEETAECHIGMGFFIKSQSPLPGFLRNFYCQSRGFAVLKNLHADILYDKKLQVSTIDLFFLKKGYIFFINMFKLEE